MTVDVLKKHQTIAMLFACELQHTGLGQPDLPFPDIFITIAAGSMEGGSTAALRASRV